MAKHSKKKGQKRQKRELDVPRQLCARATLYDVTIGDRRSEG